MLQFDEAIHSIYEAALSPDLWQTALDKVAALSGARGALIYAKADGEWRIPARSTVGAEATARYLEEGWRSRNPWLEGRMPSGFHAGDAYSDSDIISDEERRSNPFYAEFLPRFGLGYVMVALFYSYLGQPSSVAVYRGAPEGSFTQDEIARLLLVSRHIEQALRISASHGKVCADHATLEHAFDAFKEAAIILDEKRQPVRVNRSAEKLVGRHLMVSGDGVKPTRRCDESPFMTAVTRAHAEGADNEVLPQPVTISDPQGNDPHIVWTAPLVGASADGFGLVRQRPHTFIMAKPIKESRLIDPTLIRSVYGLTTAQARLASLLAAGRTVQRASVELGVAEGTVRVVLKQIFARVGVHRQSDLVRKVTLLAT